MFHSVGSHSAHLVPRRPLITADLLLMAILMWLNPIRFNVIEHPHPDFMFPQMNTSNVAEPDWRPIFVDYLYVRLTIVMALSPTDTMPLARWAKMAMAVQATAGLSTAGLVITRAVNVLG